MNLIIKCARLFVVLILSLWLAVPGVADNGDSAACDFEGLNCTLIPPQSEKLGWAGAIRDHSRPGSVIVFPLFIRNGGNRNGGNAEECGEGNVLVNRVCLPRTEIELGAVCPTRFTVISQDHESFPCTEHELVRVRFRWVCPATHFEHKVICRTTPFDVHLTVNGKIVFTANGFSLPDANHVRVPTAPCEKGYLIGWVIDEFGRPKKYDGLIGEAVIRNSGTAAASYRGITIQAGGTSDPGSMIDLLADPLRLKPPGLPFLGGGSAHPYRVITGQVTGDVTFDRPPPKRRGFGVSTSLILLTLDVRSDSPNFPTSVSLDFWNGSEKKLSPSPSVMFVCWGEFQLSDIDIRLTQAFMGTRKGIVQSDEAEKKANSGIYDIAGSTTLLGLVQTNEITETAQWRGRTFWNCITMGSGSR